MLGHSRGGLAIRAAAWISPEGGQALLWHPQLCQGPGPRVGGVLGQVRATPLSNPLPAGGTGCSGLWTTGPGALC